MSVLIGICGGSGSGKTTLAGKLAERFRRTRGPAAASVLSFDAYYHDRADLSLEERATINYDHPDALDHDLLVDHLGLLRAGRPAEVPVYDFTTHSRSKQIARVEPAEVVLVEGILLFQSERVRELLDLRVFRRCPEEVRFSRRIGRDIAERGRSLASVEAQLAATVKPMHDRFVEPYAAAAEVVTEHGDDLDAVTERIAGRIESLLTARHG